MNSVALKGFGDQAVGDADRGAASARRQNAIVE
jgi:hypothetical protein